MSLLPPPRVQADKSEDLSAVIQALPHAKTPAQGSTRVGNTQGKRQKPLIEDEDEMAGQAEDTPADEALAAATDTPDTGNAGSNIHLAQAPGPVTDAPPPAAGSVPAAGSAPVAGAAAAGGGLTTGLLVAGGVIGVAAAAAGGGGESGSAPPAAPTTTAITSNGGGAAAAVNVAENATAVTTVVGTADAGETLTYSITGGADAAKFTINPTTGVLTFVAAPDFENPTDVGANNVYDVTVQVSDGTTTDTQAIAVTVTNINDNTPVITSNGGGAAAAMSVAENTTAVTTVTATDADAGTTLTYSITGGADAAKFTINSMTGVLAFVSAPDFETPTDSGANNVYDVTVQVSDGLTTDTQAIAVTVTDITVATILSNGGGAAAAVNVAENTTAVTTVIGTADAGGVLAYSITGGADAAKFTINPTTGVLAFVAAPDFENPTDVGANNVYDVTVQVSDGTTTDSQDIAVTVTNVNDNTPVITSDGSGATAALNVAENTTAVTTVTATDADAGTTLTYSITGGADAAKFTINSTTGVLAFVTAPDFETPTDSGADNVYDVTVQVSDGLTTDTQAIAATVTNVNEAPVITSNGGGATAAINVAENTTAVTTVTSTDVDAGDGKTYSITGGADSALFNIDSSTGALTFVSGRDFETPTDAGANNVYDVQVTVTDTAGLTDVQDIAVTVTDVNEAPVITSNGGGATAAAQRRRSTLRKTPPP